MFRGRVELGIALAMFAVTAVIDVLLDQDTAVGALVAVVPGAVAVNGRRTAIVATGVLGLCVVTVLAWYAGELPSGEYVARLLACCGATGVGLVMQRQRIIRERQLARARRIADTAMRAILRVPPLRMGRIEIAVSYVSAADEARMGGDLYEVADTPFGVRALIGDVRGKGLPAVGAAASTLSVFREAAHDEPDLARIAARMERILARESGPEDFVTVLLVTVDGDGGCTAIAHGHPAPLVRTTDGGVHEVPVQAAPPLGMGLGAPARAEPAAFHLADGDELLLVTDGVVEARDTAGVFYPLAERYARLPHALPTAAEEMGRLRSDVEDYSSGGPDDDSAMVLLRIR